VHIPRKRDFFLSCFISTFFSSRSLATHACNQNPAVFRGQRAYCNSFSTHRGIEVSNGPGTCFEPFESLCLASSLYRPSLIPCPPPAHYTTFCASSSLARFLFSLLRNILSSSHFLSLFRSFSRWCWLHVSRRVISRHRHEDVYAVSLRRCSVRRKPEKHEPRWFDG